jgi:hypothetical protein
MFGYFRVRIFQKFEKKEVINSLSEEICYLLSQSALVLNLSIVCGTLLKLEKMRSIFKLGKTIRTEFLFYIISIKKDFPLS